MGKVCPLFLFLIMLSIVGCTSTNLQIVETGMFDNNPDNIIAAYNQVEKCSESLTEAPLKKKDLEEMGFKFSAPNVEEISGPTAIRIIFGSMTFQNDSKANLEAYKGFAVPYQRISKTTDRIYISHKETFYSGDVANILFLFKGEELCYYQLQSVKIDIYQSHYALGESLITILQAPGNTALSILESIQVYQYPGVEIFTRISLVP